MPNAHGSLTQPLDRGSATPYHRHTQHTHTQGVDGALFQCPNMLDSDEFAMLCCAVYESGKKASVRFLLKALGKDKDGKLTAQDVEPLMQVGDVVAHRMGRFNLPRWG